MRRSITAILLILLLATGLVLCCTACSDSGTSESGYSGSDVVKIRIYEFPLTSVDQGAELDFTGCMIQTVTAKGSTRIVDVDASMVSGYDKTAAGTQTLTVTYAGKTATVDIEVKPSEVQSISIAKVPDNFSVVQGTDLDLSGIAINVAYQNSTIVFDGITYNMLGGYSKDLPVGEHNIYVYYANHSTYFKLKVLPRTLSTVTIVDAPKKTTYFVGDEVDLTGLKLKLTYNNKTTDTVAYDPDSDAYEVTYDFSVVNQYSRVNIRYKEGDVEKNVSFKCSVSEPGAVAVKISAEPVTKGVIVDGALYSSKMSSIREGDTIDWSTGKATVEYQDGTLKDYVLSDARFNFYLDNTSDTSEKSASRLRNGDVLDDVGTHIVYIRFENYDWFTPLHITVVSKKPYKLIVKDVHANPEERVDAVTYVDGQTFSTAYLRYNILYDNGTYESDIDDPTSWDSLDENKIASDGSQFKLSLEKCKNGYQTINFAVNGLTAGFKVKVVARVATKMELIAPYRDYYLLGSSALNYEGSSVYVEYNDLSSDKISPITESYVKIYNAAGTEVASLTETGDYTAKVTVAGMSKTFTVHAVNENEFVSAVHIAGGNESADNIYECASLTALHQSSGPNIEVSYEKKGIDTMNLSSAEMLTADTGATGRIDARFRYKGYTFVVKANVVGRRVSAIEVASAPKATVYVKGEQTELELDGLKVVRTFNDGTSSAVTSFSSAYWSFGGFDPNTVGQQTITVTYTVDNRTYASAFQIDVAEGIVESISFDEEQDGMKTVTVDGAEYRAYEVTYRDDFNENYIFDKLDASTGTATEDTGFLKFNVKFTGVEKSVERTLSAKYIDYDKYVARENGDYLQSVTITYGGKTTEFWIYVAKRELNSIEVYQVPSVVTYADGQKLRMEGGYIKRTYGYIGSDGKETGETSSDVLPMTSGLIAVNGYSETPFANVYGGKSRTQTVTLTYGGKSTSFNVTSYRKLDAEPKVTGASFQYGSASKPKVTITESIEGFTAPDTVIEVLIDGEWVTTDNNWWTTAKLYPGSYPMRIRVLENEYYNAGLIENDTLAVKISRKIIIVDISDASKVYGEADKEFVYDIEESELVVGDKIEVEIWRDAGEDVLYNAQGGYASYAIHVGLKAEGDNQNALYSVASIDARFTIYPKTLDKDNNGETINVMWAAPINFDSKNNTFSYTGNPIQEFGARYTDSVGSIVTISSKDILYYDSEGKLLTSRPSAVGTYTVKISGNYKFAGTSSKIFSIINKQ